MSPRATRCVRQPRDRGQAPRGRTNGDPAGRRRSARRALAASQGNAQSTADGSLFVVLLPFGPPVLPSPGCGRLCQRQRGSCDGRVAVVRACSPLLSVGIRASPSSTDQTPQARAPAWRGRRRRSPDRGTRRRVSCLTPALPRRADRREGASCFGRNPSYDVPNNRAWRSQLRPHSPLERRCESEPRAHKDSRTSSLASVSDVTSGALAYWANVGATPALRRRVVQGVGSVCGRVACGCG
jgi:hypothetical protein